MGRKIKPLQPKPQLETDTEIDMTTEQPKASSTSTPELHSQHFKPEVSLKEPEGLVIPILERRNPISERLEELTDLSNTAGGCHESISQSKFLSPYTSQPLRPNTYEDIYSINTSNRVDIESNIGVRISIFNQPGTSFSTDDTHTPTTITNLPSRSLCESDVSTINYPALRFLKKYFLGNSERVPFFLQQKSVFSRWGIVVFILSLIHSTGEIFNVTNTTGGFITTIVLLVYRADAMLGLFLTYLGIWSLTRLFSFDRNILPSFVLLSLHAGIEETWDRALYTLLISSFVFVAAGLSNVCTRRSVPVLLVPFLFMYTLLSFSHTRVNYEEKPADVRNWTLASAPKSENINSGGMNETIHTHWALTVFVDSLHTPGALLGIKNIVPSLLLIFSFLLFSPYFLFCSVQGALISNLTAFFLFYSKEEISSGDLGISGYLVGGTLSLYLIPHPLTNFAGCLVSAATSAFTLILLKYSSAEHIVWLGILSQHMFTYSILNAKGSVLKKIDLVQISTPEVHWRLFKGWVFGNDVSTFN